jgi:hypothetical protein
MTVDNNLHTFCSQRLAQYAINHTMPPRNMFTGTERLPHTPPNQQFPSEQAPQPLQDALIQATNPPTPAAENVRPPEAILESDTPEETPLVPAQELKVVEVGAAAGTVATENAVEQPDSEGTSDTPSDSASDHPDASPPTPPADRGGDGGGQPPEGGDVESAGEDPEEARRLKAAVREFSDMLRPLTPDQLALQVWTASASAEDIRLHLVMLRATRPDTTLAKRLSGTNLERVQEHANLMATRVLEQDPEMTVPKAMAVHATMSYHSDDLFYNLQGARPDQHERLANNTTYFLTEFAHALAWQLPESALAESPEPWAFFDAASHRLSGLRATMSNEVEGWLPAKLKTFTDGLSSRIHTEKLVENEPPMETLSIEELRNHNNRLAQELELKRGYGVKSSVHQEKEREFWSLHDAFDLQAQLAMTGSDSGIRPERWSADMRMVAIEHGEEDDRTLASLIRPVVVESGNEHTDLSRVGHICYMDKKGELFAEITGITPLAKIYEGQGKLVNYEALRQKLLRNFYDLTVPVEVAQQAQRATTAIFRGEATPQPSSEGDTPRRVVHDLLLPRLREVQKYTPEELAALESPLPEAALPSRNKPSYTDMEPNVVYHKRKLPPGYKASAAALELATERGIILGEGETFVKEHYHPGASGSDAEHRAKRRKGRPTDS